MTASDEFMRFRWKDRAGRLWHVVFNNRYTGFSGYTAHEHEYGTSAIHIQTHGVEFRKLPMAYLTDVRVAPEIQDRGIGSMLVATAIEECRQRGHAGIEGYLSDVDSDHFQKLEFFYRRLGFYVAFADPNDADYRFNRAGKIELVFQDRRS